VKIMADNNNIENGAKKSPLSKIKTKGSQLDFLFCSV